MTRRKRSRWGIRAFAAVNVLAALVLIGQGHAMAVVLAAVGATVLTAVGTRRRKVRR